MYLRFISLIWRLLLKEERHQQLYSKLRRTNLFSSKDQRDQWIEREREYEGPRSYTIDFDIFCRAEEKLISVGKRQLKNLTADIETELEKIRKKKEEIAVMPYFCLILTWCVDALVHFVSCAGDRIGYRNDHEFIALRNNKQKGIWSNIEGLWNSTKVSRLYSSKQVNIRLKIHLPPGICGLKRVELGSDLRTPPTNWTEPIRLWLKLLQRYKWMMVTDA